MVRRFISAAILAGFCAFSMPAVGFAQTTEAKDDLKKAGDNVKQAGKATGEAAKDVGKATKKGTKAAKRKVTGKTVAATCKDGTTYTGKTRTGACADHGGVKTWTKGGSTTTAG
jgi:hypothetical protein